MNAPLVREELYGTVAGKLGITRADTKRVVDATIDALGKALMDLRQVQLRGLGTFKLKRRALRIARNQHTDEQVEVPPCSVVVFKPSRVIKYEVIRKTVTA